MWYDNERIVEEEGISRLLVGRTFAYFPKYVDGKNNSISSENKENLDSIDNITYDNKEYVLITQRLGRTIIPLNPELLAQSTFDQDIIDGYLNEIHKNVHNYSILTEYSFLMNEIPRNFYCLPQIDNLLIWDVFIMLYSTVYKNAKLKLQIRLSHNYPNTCPEVFFITPIFHPLVNIQTGKLNLGTSLSKWDPSCHYMSLIFLYIKNLFYLQEEYNKEIVENQEALFLLNNDKDEFIKNVQKYINQGNKKIYDHMENCMFNFNQKEEHIEIKDKLENIKTDQVCARKAEAFVHWLINEYSMENTNGDGNTTNGDENNISGDENNISGDENNINGDENNINGDENNINGDENNINGDENNINGDENNISGDENNISGDENNINGDENNISGDDNNINGDDNNINGDDNNINEDENNINEDENNKENIKRDETNEEYNQNDNINVEKYSMDNYINNVSTNE
ncbi:ubiquitin-conjugating enzyme E2, putative [Plasmodium reichenowi]|uniref:Ubiquitin-conjugating enzyme E2, putative n=1 Tax=Plasmodium reichenowi TaxID=5854 RepID=A0A2P9DIQ0_PLARE|nr:ubiquitin-conjugating enzyme E2, putative [Plasmodium reichenowi]